MAHLKAIRDKYHLHKVSSDAVANTIAKAKEEVLEEVLLDLQAFFDLVKKTED